MHRLKKQSLRFVIPVLLIGAVGIRFVQRSAAQTSSVPQSTESAQTSAPRWSAGWNRFFAHYEAALKRPLTTEEKQDLVLAYRSYRQSVAGALGLKLTDLTRKEREAARDRPASAGTPQTPSAVDPPTTR